MSKSVEGPVSTRPTEQFSTPVPNHWLLMGPLALECALWGDAPDTLLAHVRLVQPSAAFFALDLPGTGVYCQERSAGSVEGIVAQLRERIADAGLSGPFGLVASSWACAVAAEWARQFPQELGALVLISPGMRPFSSVFRAVHWELWPTVLSMILGRRSPLPRERRVWRSHTQLRKITLEELRRWRDLRAQHPVKARNGLAHAVAAWRYEASRRRPASPVLLLAGKGDTWLDWRISAAISRAWGAAFRLHPAAGHDLLLDDPQWVARSLAEWLLPVGSGAIVSSET
jgi:pimeloyl-ACP methyl ester carboxylesterase